MGNYQKSLEEEKANLAQTLSVIHDLLNTGAEVLTERKRKLIASRKDMWENTVHFTNDFAKLTEVNQHLMELNTQTASYMNNLAKSRKLQKVVDSPYFGRFDFIEKGCQNTEKIYVGLTNVMDPKNHYIYVYDWRSPIASIFYRFEPGEADFDAPAGKIHGNVLLKRQYKIKDGQLKYFFDCSIRINDEVLQEVLSRSASAKMRNIVESIQKEQDIIIRDTENDLLIVQGVAGSGKTSIAMHRVAFLLYEGLGTGLSSNNIIIISPNDLFNKYISGVLPELGEDNVRQTTYDALAAEVLGGRFKFEFREHQLEKLIALQSSPVGTLRMSAADFKGSRTFIAIMDRMIEHYIHHVIPFTDVYFDGRIIETKEQIKNRFLNNKTGLPTAKQLKRIENILFDKIHPLQRQRVGKLEKIVADSEEHQLEIKQYSRLLAMKEAGALLNKIRRFTEIDYWQLYFELFNTPGLLAKLAAGLPLPENIEEIIAYTKDLLIKINPSADPGKAKGPAKPAVHKKALLFEDIGPLLYLKLKLEGTDLFPEIRQVIVDEAQDYYPVQYEVFRLLFREAKYTLLGDFNQTIEKAGDPDVYDHGAEILKKNKSIKLTLNKSYRSTYEINQFNRKFSSGEQTFISFDRHEKKPQLIQAENVAEMDRRIIADLTKLWQEGAKSIAIICKTRQQAEDAYLRLKPSLDLQLVNSQNGSFEKGLVILPGYMAKGLEFDAVAVYNTNKNNYATVFDRRLLYIACTRALHHLSLYYTGEKSSLI